jgi:Predicted integral membrane protein
MKSIVDGYEYDVFISYRHKDNKGDHWVTEFVNALRTELEATLKDDVSIYFDSNANDGLLENHHVDKSLEGKLKCLIFIPIISQTYCDPKSFAWQHEFVAFNKLAKEDSFGRDVRLNNGNVASRILPIKIHDLDTEDKTTIENEIGGVLRAIDFIYKEPGVNRPLKLTDKKDDNQNHTDYRNQINKTANAIKEIINGLKAPVREQNGKVPSISSSANSNVSGSRKKWLVPSIGAMLVIVAIYFLIPIVSSSFSKPIDKSIAVLPFENLSGEDDAYFAIGVTEDILTQISKIGDLRVLSRFTLKDYDTKGKTVQQIGQELGVGYLLTGSIRKIGDQLRITCELVQVNPEEQTWAENFDKRMEDVFAIQSNVAQQVAKSLKAKLTDQEKELIVKSPTENLEAYNIYLQALSLYDNNNTDDNEKAIKLYNKALVLDPKFTQAYTAMIRAYNRSISNYGFRQRSFYDSTFLMAQNAIAMDPQSADAIYTLSYQYLVKRELAKAIDLATKAIELNPNHAGATNGLGLLRRNNGEIDEAVKLFLKFKKLEPLKVNVYLYNLGTCYQFLEMYPEALKEYETLLEFGKAENITLDQMARIYSWSGQKEKALETIERLLKLDRNSQNLNRAVTHAFYGKMDERITKKYIQELFIQKDFNYLDHNDAVIAKAHFLSKENKKDSMNLLLDKAFDVLFKRYGDRDDTGSLFLTYAEVELMRGNSQKALAWAERITKSENIYTYYLAKNAYFMKSLASEPVIKDWMKRMEDKTNKMRMKVSSLNEADVTM